MEDVIKKIYDYSLEEIMGDRFGKYSKYIIQPIVEFFKYGKGIKSKKL